MRCSSLRPDPFERPVPAQSGPTAGESRPPLPSRLRKAEYLPGEPACFKVPPRRGQVAFTLLEVMIACGIFFIAVFAILALVSNTLRNAQRLRRIERARLDEAETNETDHRTRPDPGGRP